jgi:hypothetical protein
MLRNIFRHRKPAALLLVTALINIGLLSLMTATSHRVLAKGKQQPPVGDLTTNGEVTINGKKVISGTTVYSNSLIKVACKGSAAVNLGTLGRLVYDQGASMQLRFSEGLIEGDLLGGNVQIEIPAGVKLNITTPNGPVVTDGKDAMSVPLSASTTPVCPVLGAGNFPNPSPSNAAISPTATALILTGIAGATGIGIAAALSNNVSPIR